MSDDPLIRRLVLLVADLHEQNQALREKAEALAREAVVNEKIAADFDLLADYIRKTNDVSGGLGAVRDIHSYLGGLERF